MDLKDCRYIIYRTKRKSIMLKLRSDGVLLLYCPIGYPKKKALKFIEENSPRLLEVSKDTIKKRLSVVFGESEASLSLLYLGKRYPLFLGSGMKSFCFDGKAFFCPDLPKLEILKLYKDFLRYETKRILPKTVETIAKENGFQYNKITIKDMYSRFGSCSALKNLNFSLALSAFDEEFLRFIVCHELCHTVFLNHRANFYSLLNKISPYQSKNDEKLMRRKYSEILFSICSHLF